MGVERGGNERAPLSAIEESPRTILRGADEVRSWFSSRQMPVPPSLQVIDSSAERGAVSRFYSGTAIGKAFDASPPIVVTVSRADFIASFHPGTTVDGHTPDALYVPGTNMLVMVSDVRASLRREALDEMVYHEMIHYAGFIGRGEESFTYLGRSSFDQGRPVPRRIEAHWLEEGLTNFFTTRIGTSPVLVYPFETVSVRMLEIMGADRTMLIEAHSGNTRRLQELVDSRLGPGAFEGLLQCPNGMEAMLYLLDRDSSGTVFRTSILDDPLMHEYFHPQVTVRGPTDPAGTVNELRRVRRE